MHTRKEDEHIPSLFSGVVFSHDHHNFLADVRLSRLSLSQSSRAGVPSAFSAAG